MNLHAPIAIRIATFRLVVPAAYAQETGVVSNQMSHAGFVLENGLGGLPLSFRRLANAFSTGLWFKATSAAR